MAEEARKHNAKTKGLNLDGKKAEAGKAADHAVNCQGSETDISCPDSWFPRAKPREEQEGAIEHV